MVMKRAEHNSGSRATGSATIAGLFLVLASALAAQAQTFQVIHGFEWGEGSHPVTGLTIGPGGNLYGTAQAGGDMNGACYGGCGTVWEITP
jgi:hypothetical protein